MKGKLVVLSGPSGVGKDTVIDAWAKVNPRVERVVACTSREPREGEVDGDHYHFLTPEEFLVQIAEGSFLEYKNVHGNMYGTPLKAMQAMLDEGKIAILKIDVQGAAEVRSLRPDAITVFILPPSLEALEARIRGRGLDDEDTIQRRLAGAIQELAGADQYQHRLINDKVAEVVQQLEAIVGGE